MNETIELQNHTIRNKVPKQISGFCFDKTFEEIPIVFLFWYETNLFLEAKSSHLVEKLWPIKIEVEPLHWGRTVIIWKAKKGGCIVMVLAF